MFKVYVGNLDPRTTVETLKPYFEPFGDSVDEIIVALDDEGQPRGFAIVLFRDAQKGQLAIETLMGKRINGREVQINEAVKKGKKTKPVEKGPRNSPLGPRAFQRPGSARPGGSRPGTGRPMGGRPGFSASAGGGPGGPGGGMRGPGSSGGFNRNPRRGPGFGPSDGAPRGLGGAPGSGPSGASGPGGAGGPGVGPGSRMIGGGSRPLGGGGMARPGAPRPPMPGQGAPASRPLGSGVRPLGGGPVRPSSPGSSGASRPPVPPAPPATPPAAPEASGDAPAPRPRAVKKKPPTE